jgi:hypothetical protein
MVVARPGGSLALVRPWRHGGLVGSARPIMDTIVQGGEERFGVVIKWWLAVLVQRWWPSGQHGALCSCGGLWGRSVGVGDIWSGSGS